MVCGHQRLGGNMLGRATAALVLAAFTLGGQANAQPSITNKTVFYPVSGSSLMQLRGSMSRSGPHMGSVRAYGLTQVKPTFSTGSGKGGNCSPSQFQMTLNFTTHLPRLRSADALSSSELSSWTNFVGYVRKHEQTHRSIYQSCMAGVEAKVRRSGASSCATIEAAAAKAWLAAVPECRRRNASYDASEGKRLVNHPFFRVAKK
jgi:predicted secreted Zn-dependent protease